MERVWVDQWVLNSTGYGTIPGMPEKWQNKRCGWPWHRHNLSGQPQRHKESWRKLGFGYRQPQGTCDHKLPHGCDTSTEKHIFFGSMSHCPKSVFSCECMWDEITTLCIILIILEEWSFPVRVTWDPKLVETGHPAHSGILWLVFITWVARLNNGAHSFFRKGIWPVFVHAVSGHPPKQGPLVLG